MPDISAISAALSSLKAAKDIAEAMITLREGAAFQSKLIEFQSKLIDANNAAFAAQEERSTLLESIRELKEKVASLEAWEAEKQRYQLEQIWPGATAYVLKPEAQGAEPIHWLCNNCYQTSKKSILQRTNETDSTGRERVWGCPSCDASILVRYDILPGKAATF